MKMMGVRVMIVGIRVEARRRESQRRNDVRWVVMKARVNIVVRKTMVEVEVRRAPL